MADIDNPTDDVSIWNDAKTKAVTVTTDGSKERLDVMAKVEGGSFQLSAFIPVVVVDSTGVTLTTASYTTLLDVTSTEGKLDFIAAAGGTSNYQIRLTIDGTEVFDLAMSDISSIGLSNATNVPVWAEVANKNFRYHPNEGVDFETSLKVEATAVSASPALSSLITYRKVP